LGGLNDDTFVFAPNSGLDTIGDFNQGNTVSTATSGTTDQDIIDVQDYGFADWADLSSHISDNPGSGDAVIQLTDNDRITLANVQSAQLTSADFNCKEGRVKGVKKARFTSRASRKRCAVAYN
jgi:hypothetical protein